MHFCFFGEVKFALHPAPENMPPFKSTPGARDQMRSPKKIAQPSQKPSMKVYSSTLVHFQRG